MAMVILSSPLDGGASTLSTASQRITYHFGINAGFGCIGLTTIETAQLPSDTLSCAVVNHWRGSLLEGWSRGLALVYKNPLLHLW